MGDNIYINFNAVDMKIIKLSDRRLILSIYFVVPGLMFNNSEFMWPIGILSHWEFVFVLRKNEHPVSSFRNEGLRNGNIFNKFSAPFAIGLVF